MKKYFAILLVLIVFTSCNDVNISQNTTTEPLDNEYSDVSITDDMSPKEEVEDLNIYPIEGLTLTDFCQFSFDGNTTLLSDMVAIVGEPSGHYSSDEPYFVLYDGTIIAFQVNEERYIEVPYIADTLGRTYSSTRDTSLPLLSIVEINNIKEGNIPPTIFDDSTIQIMSSVVQYNLNDFSVIPVSSQSGMTAEQLVERYGSPNAGMGSGVNSVYYRLTDGSYVFPITGDLGWSGKIYGIEIRDAIGREFAYKNFD